MQILRLFGGPHQGDVRNAGKAGVCVGWAAFFGIWGAVLS
jgi:hypothetical protein